MCRMPLVHDDSSLMMYTARLLQRERHDVLTAATGRGAIRNAAERGVAIAIIDLQLPDVSGVTVLQEIRRVNPAAACAILTGHASLHSAVDALRLGAVDYLFKPLTDDDLLDAVKRLAVNRANRNHVEPDDPHVELHARARWAHVVTRAASAPTDLRTLHDWGRFVGVSPGAIRNWCRTARLPPRRSLLLARVLRAVIRRQHVEAPPADLLDIVDRRTLAKLMALSGGTAEQLPPTVSDLLARQTLISDAAAINAIHAVLDAMAVAPGHRG